MLSTSGSLSLNAQLIAINGQHMGIPKWKSGHQLPGQSTHWNKAGIFNGYFTNLEPDQGTAATNGNPGARAVLVQDAGQYEVEVSAIWTGDYKCPSGPVAAINLADSDFGVNFCFEPTLDVGFGPLPSWVLWRLGRRPDQIKLLAVTNATGQHTENTPVELKLRIQNHVATGFVDGVSRVTGSVPSTLRGHTYVGVNMDVNPYTPRPKNVACLVSPATIKKL